MAPRLDAADRMLSEMLWPASSIASAPPPVQLVGASASLAAEPGELRAASVPGPKVFTL